MIYFYKFNYKIIFVKVFKYFFCVEPAPEVVKEEPAAKPVGTYKPPALRNASSTPVSSSKRYSKNAPPPSSELDFPSLSSAAETNKWKMR